MTIPASANLGAIVNGQSLDATKVNGELAWIESRAFDAGNSTGDTMQGPVNYKADSGVANAYVATLNPPLAVLTTGLEVTMTVLNSNTTNATLNVNGLGAKPIVKFGDLPLVAGDLIAGNVVTLRYDGTSWQLVSMPRVIPLSLVLRYNTTIFGFSDFRSAEENLAAGMTAVTSGTGTVVATANENGHFALQSGTTANSDASYLLYGSSSQVFTTGLSAVEAAVAFGISPGVTGTTQKVWVCGLTTSSDPGELVAANATNSGAYFRVEAAGSTVNIFCVTKNSGTETTTNTAIADGNTQRAYELVATSSSVKFSINGVVLGTHTTNLPASTGMFVMCGISTLDTNNKRSDLDWIRYQIPVTR